MPLVPVTVSVYVPVNAFLFAFTVIVELPVPVTDAGLKLTDTPLFMPDADRLTVPVNPETAVIVTESPVVPPRLTVTGEPAAILKSAVDPDEVTVMLKFVVSFTPSEVWLVTVTLYVPVGVLLVVLMVSVD